MGKKERYSVKAFDSFLKNGNMLTIPQKLDLVRAYEAKEVKQAMFSIEVNKSPGQMAMEVVSFEMLGVLLGQM